MKTFKWHFILVVAMVFVMVTLAPLVQAKPNSEPQNPSWTSPWPTPILISTGATNGTGRPYIAAAPDGHTLMIVYPQQMSTNNQDNDPYYRMSTDNGATWSNPAPIHTSPENSIQVYVTFDKNSVAHAVWREDYSLVYARQSEWAGNGMHTISAAQPSPGASNPKIIASGNNTLDVVWFEGETSDIYHARSTDGGATWPINSVVYSSNPTSSLPAVAIDKLGRVHIVWEEYEDPEFSYKGHVYYIFGTAVGNSMSWSQPIAISSLTMTPSTHDAREPQIVFDGGTVYVTYVQFYAAGDSIVQWVHYLYCSFGSACATLSSSNWKQDGNPISGQAVTAHTADPFTIAAPLARLNGCSYAYFHGSDTPEANETIYGVNSCDHWGGVVRQRVTEPAARSIYPSLATQGSWWLYLAYQQKELDETRQVYFTRSHASLYLPVGIKK